MRFWTRLLMVVALGACASATSDEKPTPSREVVTGAGRLKGKGVRMDVSVGGAFATSTIKNATTTAKPNKPVIP